MPRISYIFPKPGESEVSDRIRERRKDGKLIELDGMLMNAPLIADGYSSLLKSIRMNNSLSDDVRELVILRVAALNSAAYEWIAHEPIARAAGLTSADLAIVREVSNVTLGETRYMPPLSQLHSAALVYADHMTRSIKVPQDVFDNLRSQLLNDQQMVEITSTIAAYNMVSRILVSLDVSDMAELPVPQVEL